MDDILIQIGRKKTVRNRLIQSRITTALTDTPVVAINGPRQSGKTTLAKALAGTTHRYLTLDDETVLAAVKRDPIGVVRSLDRAVIDEIQRAPALLLAVKQSVDDDRRPGRFLITGSANLLTMPRAQESLAGRIELVTLLPFAQAEIRNGASAGFIDAVLNGRLPKDAERDVTGDQLIEMVLTGGYPESLERRDQGRRAAWCRQYLNAIVQRDLPDIAAVEKPIAVRRLVNALVFQVGQLTNFSVLAGQLGLSSPTADSYFRLLEQLFIVRRLEAWHRNGLNRLIKTPKIHFYDSGLAASCRNLSLEKLRADRKPLGALLEGFVFAELLRLASAMEEPIHFSHYRDKDQVEVDFVAENDAGALAGIEVKAAATVNSDDFAGLRKLRAAVGDDFRLGVVLYDGDEILPFGKRLWAAPVSMLWAA